VTEDSALVLPLQLADTFRICAATLFDAARGKLTRAASDRRLATWGEHAMRLAEAELEVEGLEHIEADRSYLVMSNHQPAYDIFCLFVAFPHSMRMIAKKAIFRLPLLGQGMRTSGFVEIDRSDHARALEALERAKQTMASGINVWIAPEGTRSDDGRLLPFKRGGFMMALQLGCPILPVSIVGTRDILPAKDFKVRRGQKVKIIFHPSVEAADYTVETREELMDDVKRAIASALPY